MEVQPYYKGEIGDSYFTKHITLQRKSTKKVIVSLEEVSYVNDTEIDPHYVVVLQRTGLRGNQVEDVYLEWPHLDEAQVCYEGYSYHE